MHSFQEVSTPDQRETLFKSYRSLFVNLLKMQDTGREEELPDAVNLLLYPDTERLSRTESSLPDAVNLVYFHFNPSFQEDTSQQECMMLH